MTSLQPSNGCGKTSGKQKKVISAVLQALFFQKSLSENLPISGLYIRTGGRQTSLVTPQGFASYFNTMRNN